MVLKLYRDIMLFQLLWCGALASSWVPVGVLVSYALISLLRFGTCPSVSIFI